MRLAVKKVANGERRVFWGGQSVGGGELGPNITARIPGHLGMVFQPEQESFFYLTTEWLPDRAHMACLVAGNPAGDGATRNFEQIDALYSRCDHRRPSSSRQMELIIWLKLRG